MSTSVLQECVILAEAGVKREFSWEILVQYLFNPFLLVTYGTYGRGGTAYPS